MSESIDTSTRVETPEHIAFEFRLAGPWRRLGAYAIDFAIRAAIFAVAIYVLFLSLAVIGAFGDFLDAHVALLLLGYFALEWFYMAGFEWAWSGLTPGKKATGIRVVREGGFPIGLREAVLRNLLRAADLFPPLSPVLVLPLPSYLVGAAVAFSDRRFRRLGDLVAGTFVVVEEPARLRSPAPVEPPPTVEELALVPPHPRLSIEEKKTLDAFLRRFRTLHPARREELCARYSRHLQKRLGVTPQKSAARFLQLVYARLGETTAPKGRA